MIEVYEFVMMMLVNKIRTTVKIRQISVGLSRNSEIMSVNLHEYKSLFKIKYNSYTDLHMLLIF